MSNFKNTKSKENTKETLSIPYLSIGAALGIIAGYIIKNIPAGIGFGVGIGSLISFIKSKK